MIQCMRALGKPVVVVSVDTRAVGRAGAAPMAGQN
jgi:hypothetical protein